MNYVNNVHFTCCQQASCICSSVLAKAVPRYFHQQSEALITPLLIAITHQHSKVRVEAVRALADVIQFGNNKSVEDVVPHLAQRLFDQAPVVRKAVIQLSGEWLLDLPDRYSFFHRLIPILLTGFSDEVDEIKNLAMQYWLEVGQKYAKENENDLKDKMDFPSKDPSHYPHGILRPNLGCRTLMQRNLFKILPALANDITDWILETRLKSVQLLYWLFINAEDNVTQHLVLIFNALHKAMNDDDKEIVKMATDDAELISYFVPIDVWTPLLIDNIRSSHGSFSSLAITAALIKGCEPKKLEGKYLKEIMESLTDDEVCFTLDVCLSVFLNQYYIHFMLLL